MESLHSVIFIRFHFSSIKLVLLLPHEILAVAIFVIVLWANILGSVLPLLAYKFKVDPTVVSGPAMTTLVDATGLFIYFTVAGIVFSM